MAGSQLFVTTSWDDGHELDTKLALLLADVGCSATFYVSPHSHEIPPEKRISDRSLQRPVRPISRSEARNQVRILTSRGFLTGRQLTRLPMESGSWRMCWACCHFVLLPLRRLRLAACRDGAGGGVSVSVGPSRAIQYRTDIGSIANGYDDDVARYKADGWLVTRQSRSIPQMIDNVAQLGRTGSARIREGLRGRW